MKLSIMIATVGERNERFIRLLDALLPQTTNDVEVIAYWDNFEKSLGDKRQDILESAKGEYVCNVDDDDMVPEYYCEEILKAIKTKPDYVGWNMKYYEDGVLDRPVIHSLRFDKWWQDEQGYYRNVSHLNPIKRKIALKVPFSIPRGQAEDVPWVSRVAPHVKTEVFIEKPMYYYYHKHADTVWVIGYTPQVGKYTRPIINNKHFRYHPNSKETN